MMKRMNTMTGIDGLYSLAKGRRNWGITLLAMVASALPLSCDHDPLVLSSYPLDVFGAPGRETTSQYVEMSDGVRIAVDVHLPVGYSGGSPFPAIIEFTRYWRDRGDGPSYYLELAVARGFAYVVVDERGTGASFGSWHTPLSDRALDDAWEVMDWIVAQPWSNGNVGATGVSYPGMAAHRMAAEGHPALKAIVPMSDTYDQYQNLIFPGGVFNEAFLSGWSDLVYAMDRNTSLEVGDNETFRQSPVDDDLFGELLDEAVAEHTDNSNLFQLAEGVVFRDDPSSAGWEIDDISTHSRVDDLNASGVAVYHWGSWMDAGSADGVIRAFMESAGPRRGTIGSWTHGLSENAYTGLDRWPSVPSAEAQLNEALDFFDAHLRKVNPVQDRILRYFTMGENLWKATSTWPIPGTETQTFYLGENGTLSHSEPAASDGEDAYLVDFEAMSAVESRWLSPLYADTWYPDRVSRDTRLLVYQSDPLTEDMEVTGYPVAHLELSSTHTDGAFFLYLEDVDPQGRITYVTEAVLRGIHRKVSQDPSSWERPTPFHSFTAADAQPLVPGEVTELAMGFQPVSFLFKEGHRIRIALAGHDDSAFRRIPAQGTPELRVQRNQLHASRIELPVVPRQER